MQISRHVQIERSFSDEHASWIKAEVFSLIVRRIIIHINQWTRRISHDALAKIKIQRMAEDSNFLKSVMFDDYRLISDRKTFKYHTYFQILEEKKEKKIRFILTKSLVFNIYNTVPCVNPRIIFCCTKMSLEDTYHFQYSSCRGQDESNSMIWVTC